MVKVSINSKVCYINNQAAAKVIRDYISLISEKNTSYSPENYLIKHSDMVVDSKTNTIIKCRFLVEDIVDTFYKSLGEKI